MNEDTARMGEAEFRMALRGLRVEIEPGRDLWPGIAERLNSSLPRESTRSGDRSQPGWLWTCAIAASLLMAVGLAWQFKPSSAGASNASQVAESSRPEKGGTLVQREAQGMTAHYDAALREITPQVVPAGWQPGLDALDRSALEIRAALQHDPNSRLLLQRLRDTYTRRLALARRVLYA